MKNITLIIILFLSSCSSEIDEIVELTQEVNGITFKTIDNDVVLDGYFSDPECTTPLYRINLTTEIYNNYISGFNGKYVYLSNLSSKYIGDVWAKNGGCLFDGYYGEILFNGEYKSIFYNTTPIYIPRFLHIEDNKLRVKDAI